MIEYQKDKAVVSVIGAITPHSIAETIGAVRHVRDHCFYDRIELAISAPGGDVHATERLFEFLDDLRGEGVRFDTAGSGLTASAAAFLLSLGDERRATADCYLQYHLTWTEGSGQVTAAAAEGAAIALDEIDTRLVSRLAARCVHAVAKNARRRARVNDFRPGDWPVVRRILIGLANRRADELKSRTTLLKTLRQYLNFEQVDARLLERVYRTLFTFDRPISPALARELFLIDEIGSARSPTQAPSGPSLRVPEWENIWPCGKVDLQYLRRHTLILGETGSGKTVSGVMPLVKAILAPDSGVGCALVIDPKRELLAAVRALSRDVRLVKAGTQGHPRSVLNLMASPEWALDGDLQAGFLHEAARKILLRSATLASETPARIWAGLVSTDPRTGYWQQEGGTLASVALSLALAIVHARDRIFAGVDSPASVLSAPRSLRAALSVFGEAAGILPAQRELRGALEAALGKAESEQRKTEKQQTENRSTALREAFAQSADSVKALLRETQREPLDAGLEESLDRNIERCLTGVQDRIDHLRDDNDTGIDRAVGQAGWAILRRAAEGTAIHDTDTAFRRGFEALDRSVREASVNLTPRDAAARILLCAFSASAPESVRPSPNMMALAQLVLDLFLTPTEPGENEPASSKADDVDFFGPGANKEATEYRLLGSYLAEALKPLYGPETETVWRSVKRWEKLARSGWNGEASSHYVSVLTIAQQAFREFAETAPAWTLYFGVEPCWNNFAGSDVEIIDFADAVDADQGRRVWVVQPKLVGDRGILVAKAMKAAFFEAVLGNEDRAAGKKKPLVGYIADEFHRFVTSGDGHGEQSFLDTCRSFGAFCALASQSIASIEHALAGMGGNRAQNEAAVSILLNNVGTKIFFRTTDEGTIRRIRPLCPSQPGRPLVVDVLPPSTLSPGQCFAALPDGRFERRQLEPCLPAKPVEEPPEKDAETSRENTGSVAPGGGAVVPISNRARTER